ncbi:MAG TPA: DUF3592 domain-containing protein [Anaerolineales bacterium]|nr:DUF3592 domain-containing protein [Anaerolineales bacterium]
MITSIALGLVGLLLLAIGYFLWKGTKEFVDQARPVKGTVIRIVSDSEGASAPVFKFTASNGGVIEKQEKVYSSPPGYQVGQTVDILYDPGNPHGARLAKTSSLYFAPILLAVMGVIFFASGAVMLGLRLLDLFF